MRLLVLLLGVCVASSVGFINPYPRRPTLPVVGKDHGEPLYLTPYIESGRIEEGQRAAEVLNVHPQGRNVKSYAGFITVDKKYDANMYFWYFPAENNPENAPVAVWLQGGPGASSLYAIFEESGPFYVKKVGEGLKMRDHYWTQFMNVIYIDSPVGTGFSYANKDGYAKNEVDVGKNLYECVRQFFMLFPRLQKNDFFVTGESYGGKYVPALAYTIHNNNKVAKMKINLKGVAIGNGLVDPEEMLLYSEYLYQHGLIDAEGRKSFQEIENKVRNLIQERKYLQADSVWDPMLNGDLTPYKTLFYNLTRFNVYFNYLHSEDYALHGDHDKFLQRDVIRKRIHVGGRPYLSENLDVEKALLGDMMVSVKPWLEVLMNHYRVMLYNGQLDIICAYPLTMNYVQTLKWKGEDAYKKAERKPWYVDNELAGYTKTAQGFTEVLVRNAGHMVPMDQPAWAKDLLKKFVFNEL